MKLPSQTVRVVKINHREAGAKARALRVNCGISLRQMAERMGFSAPYLSDLEQGKRNWSEKLWEAFRKATQ